MSMISRRNLLIGAGATLIAAPAILRAQQLFTAFPFRLGIASGDPSHDGFVIWTRLAPDPFDEHGGMPLGPVEVDWLVYDDAGMKKVVQKGKAMALPELAHSVHVEVGGLEPDRPYWYRFAVGGEKTQVGCARTLPPPSKPLDKIRFGVAGCQQYEDGYYTAYGHLAQEDVAFIWHYGDYIYENKPKQVNYNFDGSPKAHVRDHVGTECYTIGDYRRRYAQYKLDPDLQAAHRAAPWFVTFDDHEVVNDWTGQVSPFQHDPALFAIRRAAAMQAYYEHMPLRKASMPAGAQMQLYRRALFGDLLDAHFLDTRQFRTPQPCADDFVAVCPANGDPKNQVMGPTEEAWLTKSLREKACRWNFIGNQVMMMPLNRQTGDAATEIRNMDSWAGYDIPRERVLDAFAGLGNVVVLTGDEHQNYAGELRRKNGKGDAVAVEFVSTSISSGGDGSDRRTGSDRILANNPYLKFVNDQRGYLVCEVGRDQWQTQFRVVDRVSTPGGAISTRTTATVERGRPAISLSV
jgi:alkaline phosphatase D